MKILIKNLGSRRSGKPVNSDGRKRFPQTEKER